MTHKAAPETAAKVLAYFSDRTGSPNLSHDAMAAEIGISRTNLQRAINELRSLERLAIVRRGSGPGYPTIYRVVSTEPIPNRFSEDN